MQTILLMGLQACGKSTFYQQQFSQTHLRVNLDMLKTRQREQTLMEWCWAHQMCFVSDNTNPTREGRAKIIQPAKAAHFQVIGYYFHSNLEDCLARNAQRQGKARIPERGLRATLRRLERPKLEEGFDRLYHVRIVADQWAVQAWQADEI
jgi:predicted kinase